MMWYSPSWNDWNAGELEQFSKQCSTCNPGSSAQTSGAKLRAMQARAAGLWAGPVSTAPVAAGPHRGLPLAL